MNENGEQGSAEQSGRAGAERKPKKKRGILFRLISFLSFFLFPILLLVLIVFTLATSSVFYTSILKNSNLITTFVEAWNWQVDQEVKAEIEEKVNLEEFTRNFNKIESGYESAKKEYERINKTDEYERLREQRKELAGLSWRSAPSMFTEKSRFKEYKREELDKLDKKLEAIEKYRDASEEQIEDRKKILSEAENEYETARSILEDKKEKAEEIKRKSTDTFTGRVYDDIDTLSPKLSRVLNEHFIDIAVKKEINKYLEFLGSYYRQKQIGRIYHDRYDYRAKSEADKLRIRVPGVSLSMWVDVEKNGVLQKRHLLSHLFVDAIRETKDLNKQGLFINMFRLADTGLVEGFGRRKIAQYGVTIRNGVISSPSQLLKGDEARYLEAAMLIVTWGRYYKYAVLGFVLFMFLVFYFSGVDRPRKMNALERIFIIPSGILIVIGLAGIAASRISSSLLWDVIEDSTIRIYAESILFSAALHLFVPVILIFLLLALLGMRVRKSRLKKQEAEAA